jgi:hypothetical protein
MRLRILLSFWYYKNEGVRATLENYFAPDYPDIFVDSGAYSAWSQGGEVDVTSYADWLEKYEGLFTVYANLDVKGDVEAGLKNQAYLEGRGLQPLPVFHGGEPWAVYQQMLDEYDYVALGGIAGNTQTNTPAVYRHLIKCFRMAEGKAALHGFGITSWDVLKSFPWYSVDSSSWGAGFRYGLVPVFDERGGRFNNVQLGDPEAARKHRVSIRALGFDPAELARRDKNTRDVNCALSALSYMKAEAWLRKRWGIVEIPKRKGVKRPLSVTRKGVSLYLADGAGLGAGGNFAKAQQGMRLYLAESSSHLRDTASVGRAVHG